MVSQVSVLVGIIATLLIAIYAFKKKQLNEKGVIAAMATGITIFALGGWSWLILLVLFFISSSALSKFRRKEKQAFAAGHEKADVRDAWQVFANSLFGAVLAAMHFLNPEPALFAAFVGAVATVTADTWATEIGMLDSRTYSILGRKNGERGQSGMVSLLGFGAVAAASLFIGVSAVFLNELNNHFSQSGFSDVFSVQFVGGGVFVFIILLAGFIGTIADSALGATIQARYYSAKRKKETEKPIEDGVKNKPLSGIPVIDNDAVNFLASIIGGFVAYVLALLIL